MLKNIFTEEALKRTIGNSLQRIVNCLDKKLGLQLKQQTKVYFDGIL